MRLKTVLIEILSSLPQLTLSTIAFVVQTVWSCPDAQPMPRHDFGEQRHSRHYRHSTSSSDLGWPAATTNSNLGGSVRRIARLDCVTPGLLQAETLWGKQALFDQPSNAHPIWPESPNPHRYGDCACQVRSAASFWLRRCLYKHLGIALLAASH